VLNSWEKEVIIVTILEFGFVFLLIGFIIALVGNSANRDVIANLIVE